MTKKIIIIIIANAWSLMLAAQPNSVTDQQKFFDRPWLDTALTIDHRVDILVSQMTLEEKISQMMDNASAIERLGIPKYGWWNEGLHGVADAGTATVFPQAIGLAATWDDKLVFKVAGIISDEARAKYNDFVQHDVHDRFKGLTFWSPNINIFRDPRWGRGQETYGEDPFLTSRLGVNFVKGMQGDNLKYLKVVATPKHYAVHSGPESERHIFNAQASDRDLWDTYLYAFRALITEGKAYSIMGAYNRFRGNSCSGDDFLLGQVLRQKWGFKGYVVSDCDAVWDIYQNHKIASTPEEAASIALNSGCDLDCGEAYQALGKAVEKKLVSTAAIDQSVKRLFKARFLLGMFDPIDANPYNRITIARNDSKQNRAMALLAAQRSIVLLKNEQHVLPLKKNIKTIAVIGPDATNIEALEGNYNGTSSRYITPLEGIKNKVGPQTKVLYSQGCGIADDVPLLKPVVAELLFTNGHPGLKAEYFNNIDLSGSPFKTTIEKKVDFNWREGSPYPGINADGFSLRLTGYIVVKESGEYYFGISGDDGYRLYIGGKLLVEDWRGHSVTTKSAKITLKAGQKYPVKIEYNEIKGDASLSFIGEKVGKSLMQAALETAQQADAIVFVAGLSRKFEGEEMKIDVDGFFGGDRTDIKLPQVQSNVIRALYATGKPVILVSMTGSAVALNWENEHIPAIVQAWYPGEEGGNAIADVLFGDYNPGGRLPVTFYKSISDLPDFRDYNMKGRTYRYFEKEPLYPFGFGLSYSTFSYQGIKASKTTITANEDIYITADVTNTSEISGDEVPQLYVKQVKSSVTRPIKELKGFQRIQLAPRETKTVSFIVHPEDLGYYDFDSNRFIVEPGTFQIMVGPSSAQFQTIDISVK